MNSYATLTGLVFLLAIVTALPTDTDKDENTKTCGEYSRCSDDSDCCQKGGCCVQGMCQTWYDYKCQEAKDVCDKNTCPSEEYCYPTLVACFVAPCPPIHRCFNSTTRPY